MSTTTTSHPTTVAEYAAALKAARRLILDIADRCVAEPRNKQHDKDFDKAVKAQERLQISLYTHDKEFREAVLAAELGLA